MKLTLILFFSFLTAVGQNVKGVVLDKENLKPLKNVNIYLNKDKTGTVSNEKGEFNLKIISKINPIDSIRFSIIGYEPKKYTLSKLKELNNIVHLSKKTENLNEITIVNKRKLKRTISYKKLSPLKNGVYNFGATLVDNKLYIIGGDETYFDDNARKALSESSSLEEFIKNTKYNSIWENYSDKLQVYDIENDTWQMLELKFRKRAYHNIVFVNNYIYILGGKTLSTNRKREYLDDKIEVLNLETKQIILDNTNPHQAVNFTAFPYQDNIIVMGGSIKQNRNGQKTYTDQSHIYNTTNGYWYKLPKMTKPKEVKGIIINNKIYLIGGFNKVPLSLIESYNIITGKWNNEGNLFYGIENPALTHYGSIIYIYNDNKIITYNINTKILNEFRIDLNLKNSEIYYYKDKLYILGGLIEEEFEKSPSSKLYSIDLNEFTNTRIINTKNN
ncbi:Kelch motif-containing protein [Polaribacter sp. KT25b]|uniref:Kelch repeat-containing protein n=1 Tax=Polaribacter sp. KT25b TaxID=1855336 RepID=UPI00087B9939|nr:carboxypeptidase-like regulatory domain-containing protein [Polaribacter sp. KT25b]SDR94007.1 Kelch motif-containing protein [Polaribacter sp. KT25b]